ncbi:hypothetical protein PHISCL_10823, partial [Aspergillus sclerotialis]
STNAALYGPTTLSSSPSSTYPETTQTSTPNYPRRIKMEERRDYPDTRSPYCQQMSVLINGTVVSASPSTVDIKMVGPTPTTTLTESATAATPTYTAVAEHQNPCYCVSLTD